MSSDPQFPEFHLHLGDFYEEFVRNETLTLGLNETDLEKMRMG